MCGRYCIAASPGEIAERYHVAAPVFFFPRYNVAPAQPIPVVISHHDKREMLVGNFGFSSGLKSRVINARVESVQEKNLFKNHLQSGRCLIPASGYYEWKTIGGKKEPWYIYLPAVPIISFAGLVRTHMGHEMVILTTEASGPIRDIHTRMPLVLSEKGEDEYLAGKNPAESDRYDLSEYRMHQVSDQVNKPGREGADLIRPVTAKNVQKTLDMM